MASSLRAELLAIEGIASAELEGSDEAPQGVRVQLSAGADAAVVGVAVERVLAAHGMKSHRSDDGLARRQPEKAAIPGPPPPPGASGNGDASVLPIRGVLETGQGTEVESPEPEVEEPEPKVEIAPRIESVSVEESRQGIAIRVTVGEMSATRMVGSSADGMDAAIVAALSELAGVEAELVTAQRIEAGDAKVVTVLVSVPGRGQRVGSEVIGSGEAYAVAVAAWKAITEPE